MRTIKSTAGHYFIWSNGAVHTVGMGQNAPTSVIRGKAIGQYPLQVWNDMLPLVWTGVKDGSLVTLLQV